MAHTIALYQHSIKEVLSTYQHQTDDGRVHVELVFDDERQHYVAIRVGWVKQRSVYLCLVHLDICDNKIIIQANNTEDDIDEALIARGIPRENICVGVLPPEVREQVFSSQPGESPLLQTPHRMPPDHLPHTMAAQSA